MNKQTHCKFNLNNFLMTISSLLDNTISKNKYGIKYNSKRVSYIALRIAKLQEIEDSILSDIFSYTCVYKINLSQENLTTLPFINKNIHNDTNIIKIILTAIEIEKYINLQDNTIINQSEIISIINDKNLNNLFQESKFWYDLTDNYQLPFHIFNNLKDFTQEVPYSQLISLSNTIKDITYTYSQRIYTNSISIKCKKICDFYNFEEKDTSRMLISLNLSYLGILAVPKELLTKTKELSPDEYSIFRSIPYCNNTTLLQVFGFDDIAKFSSLIYERLDGCGYPNSLKENNLSLKDRILAILYIYQALEEKRKYRDEYKKDEIKDILQDLAISQKLDFSIVNDITNLL